MSNLKPNECVPGVTIDPEARILSEHNFASVGDVIRMGNMKHTFRIRRLVKRGYVIEINNEVGGHEDLIEFYMLSGWVNVSRKAG